MRSLIESENVPAELFKIEITDAILLQAQLDQAVHLLEAIYAVDPVAISSEFAQMPKTLQLCMQLESAVTII